MHAIHLYQQPLDRCGDNTYYNPILKEKYDDDMYKVFYRAGDYDDVPTKANIAALSTVKILLQSVVYDIGHHGVECFGHNLETLALVLVQADLKIPFPTGVYSSGSSIML